MPYWNLDGKDKWILMNLRGEVEADMKNMDWLIHQEEGRSDGEKLVILSRQFAELVSDFRRMVSKMEQMLYSEENAFLFGREKTEPHYYS
ncbi:MAG: hypothetical protein GX234_06265 [Clostridiales bacterium]|nr:hypothetical protein [Clostridiales bacterium]